MERELAPAVRVRVDAALADAALADVALADVALADVALVVRVVRVEALGVAAARVGLGSEALDAAALVARSSSCSRARTRCWSRATSSRVAMPSTPSWRLTSRWTRRLMISRFFWVRRSRSSATRPTWADWTSPCLASVAATRSA